jgi:GNAT superfamily N-acetyltransferase
MRIRPGTDSETADLSALAVESKRHWGYDEEFIERCRHELTVTGEDVAKGLVRVAVNENGKLLGFSMLRESPRPALDMLFVSPDEIGRGVGEALFHDSLGLARSRGWRSLFIESDPFAASFYEHVGAVLVGSSTSASTGRELPVYEVSTAIGAKET